MLTAVDHIIVLLYYYYYCHYPWWVSSGWALGMGMKNKITGICGIPGGELLSCLTSHLNFSRLSKCLQTSFYFFIFQTSFIIKSISGNPLQFSCLEKSHGQKWAIKSMGSQKSWTWLSNYPTTTNLNSRSVLLGRQDSCCILEDEFWGVFSAVPANTGGNWGPG